MRIRNRLALAALLLVGVASAAAATANLSLNPQIGGGIGGFDGGISSVPAVAGPPPACTADGKTDWSNACDIPMGVALGVL